MREEGMRETGMEKKWIQHLSIIAAALMVVTVVCGCGANELEDRCFPMLALVDYDPGTGETSFCYTFPSPRKEEDKGDDTGEVDTSFTSGDGFVEAWHEYENRLDKKADYNHLKVIVLGEQFVQNSARLDEMLSFMEERQSFPRNAQVCVIQNCGSFVEIEGKLSDDAGDYLESFLKNHENAENNEEVTLGDLMDEKENRTKSLLLPNLRVEGTNLVWEDTYVVDYARYRPDKGRGSDDVASR